MNNEVKCPECKSASHIKYGKLNGIQKYKCKTCNRIFKIETKQPKYSKTEKRLLSMLMNFLDSGNTRGYEIKDFLEQSKRNHPNIGQLTLKQEKFIGQSKNIAIDCYNPRLIICTDHKGITFIKLPECKFGEEESQSKKKYDEQKIIIRNLSSYCGLRTTFLGED